MPFPDGDLEKLAAQWLAAKAWMTRENFAQMEHEFRSGGSILNLTVLGDVRGLRELLNSYGVPADIAASIVAGGGGGMLALPFELTSRTRVEQMERRESLTDLLAGTGWHDRTGWPLCESMSEFYRDAPDPTVGRIVCQIPTPVGSLAIGNFAALKDRRFEWDLVVSLCRTGIGDVPDKGRHLEVWLNDLGQVALNQNGPRLLAAAARLVCGRLEKGERILVHCAVGRSRSPAVAAQVLADLRHCSLDVARSAVRECLPSADPLVFFS